MKKLLFLLGLVTLSLCSFAQQWSSDGANIYNSNTGNVGIGTSTPNAFVEIKKDQTAETMLRIVNKSAGAGASTRYDLVTGALNSYVSSELNNNNGNPYYRLGIGSGVSAAYFDGSDFYFRSFSGSVKMRITNNGNIGIGTASPGNFKLAVEGKIGAREIQVTNTNPWPDYVFEPQYRLWKLAEVEQYIKQNKHLPGVPSAVEAKDGIELGKMNAILLEKIEEMTLHIIQLNKRIEELEKRSTK